MQGPKLQKRKRDFYKCHTIKGGSLSELILNLDKDKYVRIYIYTIDQSAVLGNGGKSRPFTPMELYFLMMLRLLNYEKSAITKAQKQASWR